MALQGARNEWVHGADDDLFDGHDKVDEPNAIPAESMEINNADGVEVRVSLLGVGGHEMPLGPYRGRGLDSSHASLRRILESVASCIRLPGAEAESPFVLLFIYSSSDIDGLFGPRGCPLEEPHEGWSKMGTTAKPKKDRNGLLAERHRSNADVGEFSLDG